MPFSNRKALLYPGILILSVLFCYSLALSAGFVYDDHFQLVRNPYTKSVSTLKILFTQDVWNFSNTMQSVYYRPFHMVTYLTIYKLFGLNPLAFHLTNILIHTAAVILLWLILRKYMDETPAFLGAMLFALHPVQVEPVAWIAGTPDVLYSVFVLLSFLLYLKGRILASLIPFAAALFCKEPAILLPFVIYLDHRLFQRVDGASALKFRKWVFGVFLILAGYFALRFYAIGPPWKLIREVPIGPLEQLLTGISFAGLYILKFIYPAELNVYYDYRLPVSMERLLPGLIVSAVLVVIAVLLRKNRKFLFGLGWFLIFLLPALSVKAVSASLFSERYLYLSSAGLVLALFGLPLTRRLHIVTSALILVFGILSYNRSRVWANDITLWSDAVQKSPQIPVVNYNLATAFFHQKNWKEASIHFEKTVQLQPAFAEAHNNLAVCLYNLGDRQGAARHLREFIKHWRGNESTRSQALQRLKELDSIATVERSTSR